MSKWAEAWFPKQVPTPGTSELHFIWYRALCRGKVRLLLLRQLGCSLNSVLIGLFAHWKGEIETGEAATWRWRERLQWCIWSLNYAKDRCGSLQQLEKERACYPPRGHGPVGIPTAGSDHQDSECLGVLFEITLAMKIFRAGPGLGNL